MLQSACRYDTPRLPLLSPSFPSFEYGDDQGKASNDQASYGDQLVAEFSVLILPVRPLFQCGVYRYALPKWGKVAATTVFCDQVLDYSEFGV